MLTEPDPFRDLQSMQQPLWNLSTHSGGMHVVFSDGSVRVSIASISIQTLATSPRGPAVRSSRRAATAHRPFAARAERLKTSPRPLPEAERGSERFGLPLSASGGGGGVRPRLGEVVNDGL